MKIETKFDFGQDVFFLNWSKREIIPAKIVGVQAEVSPDIYKGGEPYTVTIYRLDCGWWTPESSLFLSAEEASKQIAIREERIAQMDAKEYLK